MVEATLNNESFDQQEKQELGIEIKKSEDFIKFLEVDIQKLEEEKSLTPRESEKYWNIWKSIAHKKIQQETITEILLYAQEWAQMDKDHTFLKELRKINLKIEEEWNPLTGYFIIERDNLKLLSETLRFALEFELKEIEYNKAYKNIKSILKSTMILGTGESIKNIEKLEDFIIKAAIRDQWTNWSSLQEERWGLDIPKKYFYSILTDAIVQMPVEEILNFHKVTITIKLEWEYEIFWANDDNYLKRIDWAIYSTYIFKKT